MRSCRQLGILLLAGLCGCVATGERTVDITPPRVDIDRQQPTSDSAAGSSQSVAAALESDQVYAVIRVFYGTDRARHAESAPEEPEDLYSSQPGPLEFGFCHVALADNRDYGESEPPAIWRFEFVDQAPTNVALRGLVPVAQNRFVSELRSDVNDSTGGEVFVFVHDANLDFAEAARRTARIAHDLRFDGPPILYSWPAESPLPGHDSDRKPLLLSQPHLVAFLQTVSLESGADKIHVIAHGMGNELIAGAAHDLAETPHSARKTRFNELVLVAPETIQRETAPLIVRVADRVTVYTPDRAGEQPGQRTERVVVPDIAGIDLVNVAPRDLRFLDPADPTDGNELLVDIRQVFNGAATTQRGLRPHASNQPAWRLPTSDVQLVSHNASVDEDQTQETDEVANPDTKGSMWSRLRQWWRW